MAFKIRSAGILKELDRQDEVNRLTQKRQDEREKLYLSLAGPKSYSAGSLAKSSSGKDSIAPSLQTAILKLQNPEGFNIGEDILAPIIASGDPEGATKLLAVLEKAQGQFKAEGLTLPTEVINEILAGVVTKQSRTKPLDMDKITRFIGRELNEMYIPILEGINTTPGNVYVSPFTKVKTPSIDEYTAFEKRGAEVLQTRMTDEKSRLLKRLGQLADLEKPTGGTDDLENSWINQRIEQIETANTSLDDNNFLPIVSLYGSAYFDKLRELNPSFKSEQLNPYLQNIVAQERIVPNRAVFDSLVRSGIFMVGDKVYLKDSDTLLTITEEPGEN